MCRVPVVAPVFCVSSLPQEARLLCCCNIVSVQTTSRDIAMAMAVPVAPLDWLSRWVVLSRGIDDEDTITPRAAAIVGRILDDDSRHGIAVVATPGTVVFKLPLSTLLILNEGEDS